MDDPLRATDGATTDLTIADETGTSEAATAEVEEIIETIEVEIGTEIETEDVADPAVAAVIAAAGVAVDEAVTTPTKESHLPLRIQNDKNVRIQEFFFHVAPQGLIVN